MKRLILLAAALAIFSIPASAQVANGTVRITSGNGAVVANVGSSVGSNGLTVYCAGGCSAPADQSSGAATALSTSCSTQTSCAATASVQTSIQGVSTAEMTITAISSPVGFTVVCDTSFDGGTTYLLSKCVFVKSDSSSTSTTKTSLANGDLAANASWLLTWEGAPSNVRVRVSAVTSGNFTTSLRGVASGGMPPFVGAAIANGAPINAAGSNIGLPMLAADSATPTTGRMVTANANGVLVASPTAANFNVTATTTVGPGLGTFSSAQQAVTASAVALGTNTSKATCIRSLGTSTQSVFIGPTGVTTGTGYELSPGDAQCWPVNNTNLIFVIAAATGATVAYDWIN